MLTLLTATGCRPQAWEQCRRLMARQTYVGPVRWVIVDDGEQPQDMELPQPGWHFEVIRRQPYWSAGQNTQALNLLAGLEVIEASERVAIIEDDDWYAPDWLATVDRELKRAELVGERLARYYNVPLRRAQQLRNARHASLCSTALRGAALRTLRAACARRQTFIDIDLWSHHPSRALFGGHRAVGMKGLPGRGGIGMGHSADFRGVADPEGLLLREWIGADADDYLLAESLEHAA